MTSTAEAPSQPLGDALIAVTLLAVAGERLGGAVLMGMPADAHCAWLNAFADLRPDLGLPLRLPAGMATAQIVGGIDPLATLATGERIVVPGIDERSRGRPLLLASAERWSDGDVAQLLAALGSEQKASTGRLIIAFDESGEDEPGLSAALSDRLAFRLRLDEVQSLEPPRSWVARTRAAQARLDVVDVPDALLRTIVATAVALGIGSSRADTLAITAARANAAFRGTCAVAEEDLGVAVRLVLAPRARRIPTIANAPPEPDNASQEERIDGTEPDNSPVAEPYQDAEPTDGIVDRMIEAAAAALPPGMLELLRRGSAASRAGRGHGRKSSGRQRKAISGRPVGHVAGNPRRDGPLHLLATIEKAAPWNIVRRRQMETRAVARDARCDRRVLVWPSDIRVRRFIRPAPSLTIFAVDASGSAAMHRLGEAKGAVELLLAECYARREHVALIAFRGVGAELVLPPTRALARARRTLAQLAGGGATPLAKGIDAAHALAMQARRAGQASLIIFLTDGRANIDGHGVGNRQRAAEHALASARRLVVDRIASLLVDVASVPSAKAADLARSMNARYLPLPNAGAHEIAGAVALGRRAAG